MLCSNFKYLVPLPLHYIFTLHTDNCTDISWWSSSSSRLHFPHLHIDLIFGSVVEGVTCLARKLRFIATSSIDHMHKRLHNQMWSPTNTGQLALWTQTFPEAWQRKAAQMQSQRTNVRTRHRGDSVTLEKYLLINRN